VNYRSTQIRIEFGVANMTKRPTSFRSYEPLADLKLEFSHSGEASDYRRDLDLMDGLATVAYSVDGVRYRREVLISAVDDLIAVRITANEGGAINLKVGLTRAKDMVVKATGAELQMDGHRRGSAGGCPGFVQKSFLLTKPRGRPGNERTSP
jgi:alpha-L-fucosidase 2